MRGLGCPVRFILTAGQRGDCPQGYPLIKNLPLKVFMADTAYDANPLRQKISDTRYVWREKRAVSAWRGAGQRPSSPVEIQHRHHSPVVPLKAHVQTTCTGNSRRPTG